MGAQVRLGVIDLGTNSVRFDVQELRHGGRSVLLHREKLMVRLGQDVYLRGRLDPAAARRTLQALRRFKRIADILETQRIVAFATSTLREAKDSAAFLKAVTRATGIELRILSGAEEAKLIAEGILANVRVSYKKKEALIDIGGGSTEISICRGKKILHCESFPLGANRLQQLFLRDTPPRRGPRGTIGPLDKLRRHIKSQLLPTLIAYEWPKVDCVVGSSGTIRVLARIAKKERGDKYIKLSYLQSLIGRMSTMSLAALKKIPGMEPKRVDMILAGAVLLEGCMEALGAKEVRPTTFALRDGILRHELRGLRPAEEALGIDFTAAYAKACKFGMNENDLKGLVRDAALLFDRLKPLHRLPPRWRDYLLLSVIFRDVGWSISPVDHGKHSYYIVKHTELPVREKWERELVAQLCLRHEGGKVDPARLPFRGRAADEVKNGFCKCLAMLRVVDALDPAHQDRVPTAGIRLQSSRVGLMLSSRRATDLARMRIQQKKDLFEKVFSRELTVASPH